MFEVKYLVSFNRDWADEFSPAGLAIYTQSQLDKLEACIEEVSWYFGTNEGYEEGDLSFSDFSVTPITQEEEATLARLIPSLAFRSSVYEWNGETKTYTSGGDFGLIIDGAQAEELYAEWKMR
jgi:hypothetical protein